MWLLVKVTIGLHLKGNHCDRYIIILCLNNYVEQMHLHWSLLLDPLINYSKTIYMYT